MPILSVDLSLWERSLRKIQLQQQVQQQQTNNNNNLEETEQTTTSVLHTMSKLQLLMMTIFFALEMISYLLEVDGILPRRILLAFSFIGIALFSVHVKQIWPCTTAFLQLMGIVWICFEGVYYTYDWEKCKSSSCEDTFGFRVLENLVAIYYIICAMTIIIIISEDERKKIQEQEPTCPTIKFIV